MPSAIKRRRDMFMKLQKAMSAWTRAHNGCGKRRGLVTTQDCLARQPTAGQKIAPFACARF